MPVCPYHRQPCSLTRVVRTQYHVLSVAPREDVQKPEALHEPRGLGALYEVSQSLFFLCRFTRFTRQTGQTRAPQQRRKDLYEARAREYVLLCPAAVERGEHGVLDESDRGDAHRVCVCSCLDPCLDSRAPSIRTSILSRTHQIPEDLKREQWGRALEHGAEEAEDDVPEGRVGVRGGKEGEEVQERSEDREWEVQVLVCDG